MLAHTRKDQRAPHAPQTPIPATACSCLPTRSSCLHTQKRSTRPTHTSNTHPSHSLQLSADKKLAHTRRDQRAPHAPQTPIPATACGCLPTRSSCSRTQETINAPHTHLKHPSQPQPAVVCRQEALARAHKKRSTRPTRTSNTHPSHSLRLSADKKLLLAYTEP